MNQLLENRSFEFHKLYEHAAKSNNCLKDIKKIRKSSQSELDNSKSSKSSPIKNKKKKIKKEESVTLQLSVVDQEATHSNYSPRSVQPLMKKSNKKGKNIDMQYTSNVVDTLTDVVNGSTAGSTGKKRNKSFLQKGTEEVVSKKVKTNDSKNEPKNPIKGKVINENLALKPKQKNKKLKSKEHENSNADNIEAAAALLKEGVEKRQFGDQASGETRSVKKAKKFKLKHQGVIETTAIDDNVTGNQGSEKENITKKSKKKKRKAKYADNATDAKAEGEPAVKTQKKEIKPEVIAKNLEGLNIGDNAHTLSNLLDEMTVVDKNNKKKGKQRQKKSINSEAKPEGVPMPDNSGVQEEKVKWSKRKWNKDKKGVSKPQLQSSVLVENLPLKILFSFKTLLSEHFGQFGTVAGVGVAEVYPTEEPKPVFTTTVYFKDEESAKKAVEEDNTVLFGGRVRVRRPLPAWHTTVAVRARAPLCDQAVSTALGAAGRIRNIRHLVKGKKATSTTFVEFDGPEAVERALTMAEDVKICGKKIHVTKYIDRRKNKSQRSGNNPVNDDHEGNSSD